MKKSLIYTIIFSILSIYLFFDGLEKSQGTRCGTVLARNNSNVEHKHKSTVTIKLENYLDVHYDDGEYAREEVSFNTYMKHDKGSRVCFIVDTPLTKILLCVAVFSGLGAIICLSCFLSEKIPFI